MNKIMKILKGLKDLLGIKEKESIVDLFFSSPYPLDESSLIGLWSHIKKSEKKRFGGLIAGKSFLSPRENEERFKQLQRDVRSAGYGYVKIRGYYVEKETEDAVRKFKTELEKLEQEKAELRKQKRFANAEEIEAKIGEINKRIEELELRSYEDALFVPR